MDKSQIIQAANEGNADSQYILGDMYAEGDRVTKNLVEAFIWWKKAADQGHENAITKVAMALERGEGVELDVAQAMNYWLKRAELNCSVAQSIFAEYNAKLYHAGSRHHSEGGGLPYTDCYQVVDAIC
jgi:uncharacterized protein